MFLNKYNGDISVFVDLPYEEKDIGTDKPKWIWQCYDKDFNLITERQILHTDWGFGAVFNSDKGIMMMDNNYQNPNKPFERKMFVFK
jgi:Cu2+-containing amine oxidase